MSVAASFLQGLCLCLYMIRSGSRCRGQRDRGWQWSVWGEWVWGMEGSGHPGLGFGQALEPIYSCHKSSCPSCPPPPLCGASDSACAMTYKLFTVLCTRAAGSMYSFGAIALNPMCAA